jgi:hypothetical protein
MIARLREVDEFMKRTLLHLVLVLGLALPVAAQIATGNIYGLVTDESGAPLPGVAVAVKGAAGSVNTVSGSDGRFRVLNLAPGAYKVTTTLTGFSTINRDNVVVTTGSSVDIPVSMKVASVEETITVTAESPVIDTKKMGTATVFDQDELSKIPNSRDPWALLRTVPGVILDRVNIAGNESGQQSAYRAKGASGNDGVWALDGVQITDMAAIGASPTYFDYDAFQEIQITTSGNDIRQPTGGVGINFVTKRGTNQFHGTVRGYFTHEDMASSNVPDELAATGVTDKTANHNKQVADYGFDVGGPIVKDKLWFWGSWGKQDIRLVRSAGNLIDKSLLKDTNVKVNWQATKGDMISGFYFLGAKEKFGRAPGQQQVEPDSATWNQVGSYPENRPHGLWKLEDNHIFSPNLFMSAKVAYYGAGFALEPRGGLDQQAGIAARLGQTFGSTQLSLNVRPQYVANMDLNYFRPGMGGNHEIKLGGGYRWTEALTGTLWPGDKTVAYDISATNQRARVLREGKGINRTFYTSAYIGDTFTKDRLTLNLGVRFDHQTGRAVATDVEGNGSFPNAVPGISFAGYDAPFAWNDFAPRLGLTYSLDKARKTLVRASYARYATQLDTGIVGFANPSANAGWAEYPWVDRNGDHLAQPGEVTITPTPLATGAGFNPAAPTAVTSANLIDANLKAPITNEGVFGLDRELFPNFAVSVTYTYRKFSRFVWRPRIGMTAADYTPGAIVAGVLPDGTPYNIQTFNPVAAKVNAGGSGRFETNDPDYSQSFNGLELAATKRLSNRWMARLAAGWNNHREFYQGTAVASDFRQDGVAAGNPSPLDTDPLISGGQVAPRTSGSGSGDVFLNAKWAINASAMYQLPANFEFAASLFGKQGTPYPLFVNQALGLDGTQRILILPSVDAQRFKDLWNLDLRLAKNLHFGRGNVTLTADLFNVFNSNTEINRQRNLQATTYHLLTDNLSPRILRIGMRLGF